MERLEWFVIMTKPGRQDDTATRFTNAGFTVFNPKLNQYSKKRAKYLVQPLFPMYVFIKLDINEHFRTVNYTRGVSKILGIGRTPAPIDEAIVNNLMNHCKQDNIVEARYSYEEVQKGDKIKIIHGPFEGVEAVVSGIYNEKQRIEILLDLMKISIEKKNLKKI